MYAIVSQERGIHHRTQYCINDLVSVSSFYLTNHCKIQWLTSIMYYFHVSAGWSGVGYSWLGLPGPLCLKPCWQVAPENLLMLQQEGSVISCREQEWWAWPPAIMTHELRKNKEEHTLSLKQAKMNPKR